MGVNSQADSECLPGAQALRHALDEALVETTLELSLRRYTNEAECIQGRSHFDEFWLRKTDKKDKTKTNEQEGGNGWAVFRQLREQKQWATSGQHELRDPANVNHIIPPHNLPGSQVSQIHQQQSEDEG